MKKLIIVLLIMGLTVGCNSSINIDDPSVTDKTTSMNDLIVTNKSVSTIDILNPCMTSYRYKDIEKWQAYFNEKYNVELTMTYKSIDEVELNDEIYNDEKPYILYLNNPKMSGTSWNKYVYDFCNPVYAHDLSDFYSKYNWYQYIDSQYIELASVDGKPYAIPIAGQGEIIARLYNKEYLDALNMEVPKNISEFFEYLMETKILVDDEQSYYPLLINCYELAASTADIFRAFGIYPNEVSENFIGYNPLTDSYEDCIYSNNIEEALEYFRMLQENELLLIYGKGIYSYDDLPKYMFESDTTSINKNVASEYYYIYNEGARRQGYDDISYETMEGYYLEGTNKEKLLEVYKNIDFYIFPNSTSNIESVVELFNQVFTDESYINDLKHGMENIDYEYGGYDIIINQPTRGSFVNLNTLQSIQIENQSQLIINETPSKLQYEINTFNDIWSFIDDIESPSNHNGVGESLFYTGITAKEAIALYREIFNKYGYIEKIDEINKKLGKTTSYNYDVD